MIVVREATADDAYGIAAVNVVSWQEAYRGLIPDDVLAGLSVDGRASHWAEFLASGAGSILVVTRESAIIGFVSFGRGRDDDATTAVGALYAIYVHPQCWREGIGTLLHDAALRHLRLDGYTSATLWVLDGNDRAIGFYRRHGWSPDGATQVDAGPGQVDLHELRLGRDLAAEADW